MDLGTIHLLLNMHHLKNGTIDLDSQIRKSMKEVGYPTKQTCIVSAKTIDKTAQSSQSTNREPNAVASCSNESCNTKLKIQSKKNTPLNTNPKGTRENIRHKNALKNLSHEISSSNPASKGKTSKSSNTKGKSKRASLKGKTVDLIPNNKPTGYNEETHNHTPDPVDACTSTNKPGYFKVPWPAVSTVTTKEAVSTSHSDDRERTCSSSCLKRGRSKDINTREESPVKLRKDNFKIPGPSVQYNSCGSTSREIAQETTQYDEDTLEKITQALVKAQTIFEIPINTTEKGEIPGCSKSQMSQEVDGEQGKPREVSALQKILTVIEQRVVGVVRFTKRIPGFSDLNMDDRLSLLKASKSESQMINSTIYDGASQTLQTSSEKISREELIRHFPKEYLMQRALVDKKISDLHLTEREAAVVRAVIVTYPDRAELKDREAAEKLYGQLRACLLYVIKQAGYQNEASRLKEIDDVLQYMRNLTDSYNHMLEEVFRKSNLIHDYGVTQEFMDL